MRLLRRFSVLRTRRLRRKSISSRRASSSRRRAVSSMPLPCSESISSTPERTRSISVWRRSRARSAATSGGSGRGTPGVGFRSMPAMLGAGVAGICGKAGLGFEGEEAEAADCQFVAVGEPAPVDDLTVEEDAVEAAIVEDAQGIGLLGDDQGVAAGDAGIVEADVGRGAAPD